MILKLEVVFLLGLLTGSIAVPLGETPSSTTGEGDVHTLEKRAAGVIPASVNCGGVTITDTQILAALNAGFTPAANGVGTIFPKYFGNRGASGNVLTDPDALAAMRRRNLEEQPVGIRGTWTGGDWNAVGAGGYRVVFDKSIADARGSYIGMMYHPPGDRSGFLPCTGPAPAPAPACPAPAASSPAAAAPGTTTRRSVWEILRRAVGGQTDKKKPKPVPSGCSKPTAKPTATKTAAVKPTKTPVPSKSVQKPKPTKTASGKPGVKTPVATKPTKPTKKPIATKPAKPTKKPAATPAKPKKTPAVRKPKKPTRKGKGSI